jgi:hypothetical protein
MLCAKFTAKHRSSSQSVGGCSPRAFESLSDGASGGVNYLSVSMRKRDACGNERRHELSVRLRDPLL